MIPPENHVNVRATPYAHGNPVLNTDPSGHLVETVWDVANLGMSLHGLTTEWGDAGFGMRTLLVGGVLLDGAGVLLPLVPSFAGTALKGYRASRAARPYRALDKAMTATARKHRLVIATRERAAGAQYFDPYLATKPADFKPIAAVPTEGTPFRYGRYQFDSPKLELEATRYYGPNLVTPDVDLAGIARVLRNGTTQPIRLGTDGSKPAVLAGTNSATS